MTSQPGKQTITIQILSNISKSKNNQTMKFGQLIETFLLRNHTQNVVEKYFISKKSKFSISLDQYLL